MFKKYVLMVVVGMMTIAAQAQNIVNIFDPKVPFIWLGLDFTEAHIVGEGERIGNEAKLKETITDWNDLLVKEAKKFDVKRSFHKQQITIDFTSVNQHNNALDLSGKLLDHSSGNHLDKQTIQSIVDSYDFGTMKNLGLMVNVESFDLVAKKATLWFTVINLNNRAVVFAESMQTPPGGAGVRNNWANAFFEALERIEGREYRQWKERQSALVDLGRARDSQEIVTSTYQPRTSTSSTPQTQSTTSPSSSSGKFASMRESSTTTQSPPSPATRESTKTQPAPVQQTTTSTASTEPKSVRPNGQYFALLIGVSKYNDPKLDLENPVKDARKMKETLGNFYDFAPGNIIILENPTRGEIFSALYKLRDKVTANDNLLLFYAGHGYWDEKIKQGYWWPKDASTSDPANWLSNSDLREQLRGINSAHTLLVSDACFSGGIFRTRDASAIKNASLDYQLLYKMPSRRAITSGTLTAVPDQSVFVEYFIKRLQQNDQPFLPAQQLFGSLRLAVINNSAIVPQEGVIAEAGDEGGDFIFIKKTNPK